MKRYYKNEEGYIEHEDWQPEYWIDIESPSEEDLAFLRDTLHVPDTFIESARDEDENPRFDREQDWLLTILRIPQKLHRQADSYTTLTLAVITKKDLLITICNSHASMLSDFKERTKKRHLSIETKPDFILHLIYYSTYWYLNYLKEISKEVSESVSYVSGSVKNEDLMHLMHLQKSLVYFNTSLRGNTALAERLDKMFEDNGDAELLEDVMIELQQAQNTVNIYLQILSSTMDTLESVISNNVNQIMKKMTSVSIILMLPTLIASFYGMNVAVAYGNSAHSFWGIIIFSCALAVGIYLWLRKINWI